MLFDLLSEVITNVSLEVEEGMRSPFRTPTPVPIPVRDEDEDESRIRIMEQPSQFNSRYY